MAASLIIPIGWSLDVDGYGKGYDILESPPCPIKYACTIDWERRRFVSGMSTTGKPVSNKKYRGRGWKQALLNDAVSFLLGLHDSWATGQP